MNSETLIPQQSLVSVKLSNPTFQNRGCRVSVTFLSQTKAWRTSRPCRFISQSKQFTFGLLDPVNLNDPCDSLKETLRLKWSIAFHGLCPNDWWHFLRHRQRRPLANLERHLNAKILSCHEQSHTRPCLSVSHQHVSACSKLEKALLLEVIKTCIFWPRFKIPFYFTTILAPFTLKVSVIWSAWDLMF